MVSHDSGAAPIKRPESQLERRTNPKVVLLAALFVAEMKKSDVIMKSLGRESEGTQSSRLRVTEDLGEFS